jgi:hypothetical protein
MTHAIAPRAVRDQYLGPAPQQCVQPTDRAARERLPLGLTAREHLFDREPEPNDLERYTPSQRCKRRRRLGLLVRIMLHGDLPAVRYGS